MSNSLSDTFDQPSSSVGSVGDSFKDMFGDWSNPFSSSSNDETKMPERKNQGEAEDEESYKVTPDPFKTGSEQFEHGHFGLAAHYFRDAAERAPNDASPWIAMAASYDRLKRFDLADRAYARAIMLGGETVLVLNNEGYSYLLRGDIAGARDKFQKALKREPKNETVINNLKLLEQTRNQTAQAQ